MGPIAQTKHQNDCSKHYFPSFWRVAGWCSQYRQGTWQVKLIIRRQRNVYGSKHACFLCGFHGKIGCRQHTSLCCNCECLAYQYHKNRWLESNKKRLQLKCLIKKTSQQKTCVFHDFSLVETITGKVSICDQAGCLGS